MLACYIICIFRSMKNYCPLICLWPCTSEDDILLDCVMYCDIVLGYKYPFMLCQNRWTFGAPTSVIILAAPHLDFGCVSHIISICCRLLKRTSQLFCNLLIHVGVFIKYAPIHSHPQWTQEGGVTLVLAVYWPWLCGAVAWFGVAAIALIVESCELELFVGV